MATRLKAVDEPEDTLHTAMASAFAEIEAATKDAENPAFARGGKATKYANLGAVIDAVKPALVNHGLWVTQRCQPAEDGVSVETVLHHRSGQDMSLGTLYVPANKRDPQGFGSALTYARRYAFQTAFVVPTEDDDGNAATRAVNDQIPIKEPAAREVLDGPYTSKTALRKAVNDIITQVRKVETIDDLETLKKEHKRTINQALRDWPVLVDGDPNIPEDLGLKGEIAKRHEELDTSLGFQLLMSNLAECKTPAELQGFLAKHGDAVGMLDGAESRQFETAYDAKAEALKADA